jgi:hypothetical protein
MTKEETMEYHIVIERIDAFVVGTDKSQVNRESEAVTKVYEQRVQQLDLARVILAINSIKGRYE